MFESTKALLAAACGVLSLTTIHTVTIAEPAAEKTQAASPARWLIPAGSAHVELGAATSNRSDSDGRITLGDGRVIRLRDTVTAAQGPRGTLTTARVIGGGASDEESLILSRVGDNWHGLLMTRDGWQELTGTGLNAEDMLLTAHAVDPSAVPRCGGAIAEADLQNQGDHEIQRRNEAGSPGIVEYTLLACYTSQSRFAAGGSDAIIARVMTAVELTNTSYELSEIDVRVRLVGTLEMPAREDDLGEFDRNLSFFTASGNDYYPQAEPARDLLGADLMTLLIDRDELCGIAWLFTGSEYRGVSVCAWHCIGNTGTLAHEIGHNFGCAHDRPNANSSTTPYGYGHRFNGTDGTLYRTLMSYQPGAPIARFSNPDVSFAGTPTGVPIGSFGEAHNAQVIRDNAPAIAQFRTEESPDVNGNFIDDQDDIAIGTSRDMNEDGIPDEAQAPVLRVASPDQLADWPDAITDAGLAFAAAASDASLVTEVRFASGVYPVEGVANDPMLTQDGVRYLGGYDPESGERDPVNTPTVLSGDLLGNDDPADPATLEDNTLRIAEGFNLSASTLIDGFVFRDARAFGDIKFGAGYFLRGAGVLTFRDCSFTNFDAEFGSSVMSVEKNARAVLDRCVIAHNVSEGGDAGISGVDGGRFEVTDCVFEHNISGFLGGAVSLFAGGPSTFDGCRFEHNSAVRGGGAIRVAGGGLVVRDSAFINNTADNGGAVIINSNASPEFFFDRCEFLGNDAVNGGAIYADAGTQLDIARTRIAGNSASQMGGGIALVDFVPNIGDPALRMHASVVVGNSAGTDGGAIGSDRPSANVSIASSVIAFNDAQGTGGGVSLMPGSLPAIDASLIYGNTASDVGGVSLPAPQFAQLTNTALWGNADDGTSIENAQIAIPDAGFAIINRNAVQDDTPGDGIAWTAGGQAIGTLDREPVFVQLAEAGPDGVWGTTDDIAGDWRGSAGSPMSDAGLATFMIRDIFDLDGDGDFNELHAHGIDGRARIAGDAPDIGPAEGVPNCSPADLAEPFATLDHADISVFVTAFGANQPPADLTGDGIYDLGDITVFVTAFSAGCP